MRSWPFAIVASLYVAVYATALTAGFVYEDRYSTELFQEQSLDGQTRSLTIRTFAAQAGQSAAAHHAVSLVLHAVVVLLSWIWLRTLHLSPLAAGVGATVFLMHPMSVEATAYVGARYELIAALFIMLACCLIAVRGWAVLVALPAALVACFLAPLGKESGLLVVVVVPSLLLVRRQWDRAVAVLAVLGAYVWLVFGDRLVAISMWVTSSFKGEFGCLTAPCPVDSWEWFRWQATAAVRLLGMLFTAVGNSVVFDVVIVPLQMQWLAVGWLAVLVCSIVWLVVKDVWVAAGLAWMLAVIVPRLIIPTPGSEFNQHQFYTALPGFALVVARAWDYRSPACRQVWR